ncbi:ring-cleaving dioxygenase [Lentibacillus cibarius]|uniref:Ring-cleaving dioxygenase n=1 Tax=Lentibacillus cibarius TaxID=2583219 RepID=A0A549YGF0_9BACI|nr:ring-cleaving dioxygenase [Lentibacillus cibarius]TRM10945.1 ring-cleaving dioxygenase [Lentibacillus cibarius]
MTDGLLGIHHVTAMTDNAERNYQFFTEVLGMRLVKKTINQDDIHTYHTFFADDVGSPGTDMTFFDFPNVPKGTPGTNSISRVGLRVPNDAALDYYLERFKEFGVKNEGIQELFGKKVLPFEESDGQRYQLFSDENNEGVAPGTPWKNGPVPEEKAIYGLGPVEITVSYFEDFKRVLATVYGMKPILEEADVALFDVGEGGNGGQVIVRHDDTTPHRPGYGQVHHVSFRVKDHETIKQWESKYDDIGMRHSGIVDRFYFEALYTNVGDILIEVSTDGPGFMDDEPYETLGESLALPPFLESQRAYIEAQIRPFDTKRS